MLYKFTKFTMFHKPIVKGISRVSNLQEQIRTSSNYIKDRNIGTYTARVRTYLPWLDSKVAIITDGLSVTGLSIAEELLSQGAQVVIADDIKTEYGDMVQKINDKYGMEKILFYEMGSKDLNDIQHLFEVTAKAFQKVDIVINNTTSINELNWEMVVRENTHGTLVLGTLLGIHNMGIHNSNRGGTIINVSSISSSEPSLLLPLVSGLNAFSLAFTQTVGHKWFFQRTGVRVMGLLPDSISTDLKESERAFEQRHVSEQISKCILKMFENGESGDIFGVDNGQNYKVDNNGENSYNKVYFPEIEPPSCQHIFIEPKQSVQPKIGELSDLIKVLAKGFSNFLKPLSGETERTTKKLKKQNE